MAANPKLSRLELTDEPANRKVERSLRNQNDVLVGVVLEIAGEYFIVPLRGAEAMTDIGPYPTLEHAIFNARMIFGECINVEDAEKRTILQCILENWIIRKLV